jgi:hypothetical protein
VLAGDQGVQLDCRGVLPSFSTLVWVTTIHAAAKPRVASWCCS